MKKVFFIIVLVAAAGMIGWAVYDFVGSDSDEDTAEGMEDSDEIGLERGKFAPDFELKTLDGKSVKLSDYRGQKVIVNFWATWCPPCREEIPDLQKLYNNKDVEILAVDLTQTEKNLDDVRKFVNDDFEMTFPVLMDEVSDVANMYDVMAYPTSYMIDTEGRVQFIALGAMNYEQMEERFDKLD